MKIYSSCTLDWYTNFCVRFGEYAYEKNCNNFSFLSNSTQHIYLTSDEIRMLRYSYSWNIYQANEWKYGTFFFFFANDIARAARKKKKKKTIKVFDKTYQRTTRANVSYLTVASCVCVYVCTFSVILSFLKTKLKRFVPDLRIPPFSRILSPIFSFYIHRVK